MCYPKANPCPVLLCFNSCAFVTKYQLDSSHFVEGFCYDLPPCEYMTTSFLKSSSCSTFSNVFRMNGAPLIFYIPSSCLPPSLSHFLSLSLSLSLSLPPTVSLRKLECPSYHCFHSVHNVTQIIHSKTCPMGDQFSVFRVVPIYIYG